MPLPNPGVSELDARLAEIGRRLLEIQAGLAPDAEFAAAVTPEPAAPVPAAPEPAAPPVAEAPAPAAPEIPAAAPAPAAPEPEPPPLDSVVPERPGEPPPSPRSGPLAALLARSRRRRAEGPAEELATLVQMHNGLITALGELVRLLGSQAGGTPAGDRAGGATVSAGPFRAPDEVEAFAARLSELPPVHTATVVGYEGADRALIEVQLEDQSG